MSNYTVATNFGAKDSLASGNPAKLILGAQLTTEFNNIATAIATKYDATSTSIVIPAPGSGSALTISGAPNAYTVQIKAAASGTQQGLLIQGGAASSDLPLVVLNQAGSQNLLVLFGDGGLVLGSPTGSTEGLGTLNATGLFINGQTVVGVPQNLQTGTTYTLVLTDNGKQVAMNNVGAHTCTIPANSSVAFPIGATVTFVNPSAAAMTIAITTDTLVISGTGTVGSRTLAQNGVATALKTAATLWNISGAGLS